MDRLRNQILVNKKYEAVVVSVVFAITILMIRYPNVAEWNLGDNDNFMRLHQIMTFIESPFWYLHPLKDFNPQDGQIIHWSRIPDLPILAVYYVTHFFFDETTAIQLSIAIVPLIYLIILTLVLCQITKHIFGTDQPVLTTIYTFFSVASLKFLPGHIDHHNLQILLFCIFILLTFSSNYYKKTNLFGSALSIALSLLIGLEVLPFYILALGFLTLYSLYNDQRKLIYIRNLSFLVFIFGLVGLLIFEPISNLSSPKYDTLTFELLCYFFSASLALHLTTYQTKLTTLLISSLFLVGGIWLIYPEALRSPYSDYPDALIEYWLNHVSEAQSLLIKLTQSGKLAENWLYIGTILPTIFSFFWLKEKKQKVYYLVFLLSLLPAIFWQARTILFSSVLSIPLQIIIGIWVFNKIKIPVVRIIIPLLIAPILMAGLINYGTSIFENESTNKEEPTKVVDIIRNLKIENKKVFASMDDGAEILALTNNSIISAPYHRNINGNLLFINTLLSESDIDSLKKLTNENIDIFIFNKNDNQNKLILNGASDKSLINRLISGTPPNWLLPIIEDKDGFSVYELKR